MYNEVLTNENIIHIKKKNIEYIQFKRLLEYSEILTHCYTLRVNNIDFKSDSKNLEKSYKILCEELKLNNIVRPKQTHTDNVQIVKRKDEEFVELDGLITNKKNIATSLTFADCTPILLFDYKKRIIGNIHSGWRGTLKKIGKRAVEKMITEYNCDPKNIIACIGPCIEKCHFEVEEDVKTLFEKEFSNYNDIIEKCDNKEGKQKYRIDTNRINRLMLMEVGVIEKNIIESGICTVCNKEQFHSYRGDKEKSGRNTSIMMIN